MLGGGRLSLDLASVGRHLLSPSVPTGHLPCADGPRVDIQSVARALPVPCCSRAVAHAAPGTRLRGQGSPSALRGSSLRWFPGHSGSGARRCPPLILQQRRGVRSASKHGRAAFSHVTFPNRGQAPLSEVGGEAPASGGSRGSEAQVAGTQWGECRCVHSEQGGGGPWGVSLEASAPGPFAPRPCWRWVGVQRTGRFLLSTY